ncbi:GTP cyclohydrolase 1 type 2 [Vibrio stylophorae]|uniref:GTP cyclohydrolase 1 type 2 n=1 Tax=Vibrio stylophorae TaxID=659351 RepID=A0ABM8ZU93_9VIBR|nr:Nif3-like dinuclear metal center hexameric protein [Vibrio stylophorae]CAH0533885.1 GTP cyclohydrolase 1 type 2 [Vibrio stylophorae]
MNNIELEQRLNQELRPELIQDYCPNGLQIEGKQQIRKIVTGVTACQALIDAAIEQHADALLVHHGFFWKGESAPLRGMKYRRIAALIQHEINLYAYHLPLDIHPTLGNNAMLAKALEITVDGGLEIHNPQSIAMQGHFEKPVDIQTLTNRIERVFARAPLHIGDTGPQVIRRIAWCTGGGQDFIDQAAAQGIDAFISGEVSERTTHSAREQGIHYFAAGHHATERGGVKALGEWLAETYGFDVTFIDVDNPV